MKVKQFLFKFKKIQINVGQLNLLIEKLDLSLNKKIK